jgi:hypothetical protein
MGKAGTLLFLALVMASLGVAVTLSVSMLVNFFL